tara:strand:- start:412 stop:546 length:135 start_codon:yes stop_codon:yes gene_type:complete
MSGRTASIFGAYSEAVEKLGEEFEEGLETHDICDITGHGGSCGV